MAFEVNHQTTGRGDRHVHTHTTTAVYVPVQGTSTSWCKVTHQKAAQAGWPTPFLQLARSFLSPFFRILSWRIDTSFVLLEVFRRYRSLRFFFLESSEHFRKTRKSLLTTTDGKLNKSQGALENTFGLPSRRLRIPSKQNKTKIGARIADVVDFVENILPLYVYTPNLLMQIK